MCMAISSPKGALFSPCNHNGQVHSGRMKLPKVWQAHAAKTAAAPNLSELLQAGHLQLHLLHTIAAKLHATFNEADHPTRLALHPLLDGQLPCGHSAMHCAACWNPNCKSTMDNHSIAQNRKRQHVGVEHSSLCTTNGTQHQKKGHARTLQCLCCPRAEDEDQAKMLLAAPMSWSVI